MALKVEQKKKVIEKYQLHDKDTGSPQVQIAILTYRIDSLQKHLTKHKKDLHSKRGLLQLVGHRRRLLKYLEKTDEKSFKSIKKDLKLD